MKKIISGMVIAAALVSPAPAAQAADMRPSTLSIKVFDVAWLPPAQRHGSHPLQEGVDDSAYTGKYYRGGKHEDIRKCIIRRESRGDYNAVSATGKYRGAYQVSPELTVGMSWMIRDALVEEGMPMSEAADIARDLRELPMNKWAREWQDMGFYVTLNYGGRDLSGIDHWRAGAAYSCG